MRVGDVELNAELEDILGELQKQLRQNGVPYLQKFKRSGDHVMCQCPFHKEGQERRLSAGIRVSDGLLHCFACGEVKSLQEVVSHCFGHGDDMGTFGWKWLIQNFGIVEREERRDVELDFERHFGLRGDSVGHGCDFVHSGFGNIDKNISGVVLEKELEGYRYYHPYWKRRGITDPNIIELFDLGYDPKTRCITMPVRDVAGRCLFVARRSVVGKYFNYPRGAEKPLYGLYELSRQCNVNEVVLCESMIDALSCWQWGRYALATNGTQVSELQFQQLQKLPYRKFVLAMDNDEAGMRANERIEKRLGGVKLLTRYVLPLGKKDINELTEMEFTGLQEIF